jgi:multiple sugar transport system ATP-binding protein
VNAIELRAVSKRFGATQVLRSLDLHIAPGEFLVLVGPSGCGKSTLLRLIAGLEELSSGEIRMGGRRVDGLPPRERDIAMVFQSYALYPHMSVADNMGYSLKLRGTSRAQIQNAVQAAAAKLGLEALLDRKPRALSGGQRQRVAMGRAIVRKPGAFLFDEPLSNLDARLREHMRAEIKRLHREIGATSIYVTHDQIEAMTLADRIVALDGGVVQQIGVPQELYDRPVNLFVAGFIGSPGMNMFPAALHFSAGRCFLRHPALELPLSGRQGEPGTPAVDARLTVGIRPEHVVLGTGPLSAVVELIEPTGLGTIVHLRLGTLLLKAFSVQRLVLTLGAALSIDLPESRLHVFDAAGERVGL